MSTATKLQQLSCPIILTNAARTAISKHFHDEQALFKMQQAFYVYIEKESVENNQVHLSFYFEQEANPKLAEKFPDKVVIIDAFFELNSGLVAKSFRFKGLSTPIQTNRRERLKLHFVPTRMQNRTYPEQFIRTIAALPVSKERYEYVNKRIMSWEGYLKVQNKNAEIDDIETRFSKPTFSSDFTHVSLQLASVDAKAWKQLKGLSARIRGMHEDIGEVVKVHKQDRLVDIELKPHMQGKARRNQLDLTESSIAFSNASTKSQLQRLLKGFGRLKDGLAANPNLDTILFEDKPVLQKSERKTEIEFHNSLNEFQRAAVQGALDAEDLYVIQGPPGTGKTTVISEICTQNVKRGLKTLVASQSNLAVDNALSRLLSNTEIRILRYGRTESIEEDGKKFIEENVATYWKDQTYAAICNEITNQSFKEQQLKMEVDQLTEKLNQLKEQLPLLLEKKKAQLEAKQELPKVKDTIIQLKAQLKEARNTVAEVEKKLATKQTQHTEVTLSLNELQEKLSERLTDEAIQDERKQQNEQLLQLQQEVEAARAKQQLQLTTKKLVNAQENLHNGEEIEATHEEALALIAHLKKVYEIEHFMEQYNLRRSFAMDRLLAAIERIQETINETKVSSSLMETYRKAITYCKMQLQIEVDEPYLSDDHTFTIENCESFIDSLREAIKLKKIHAGNGQRSVESLYRRYLYLQQCEYIYKDKITEAVTIFTRLKEEIARQFNEQKITIQTTSSAALAEVESLKQKQAQLQSTLAAYNMEQIRQEVEITPLIKACKSKLEELEVQKEEFASLTLECEKIVKAQAELTKEVELLVDKELAANGVLKQVNRQGIEAEKQYAELEALLKEDIEQQIQQNEEMSTRFREKCEKLETELVLLPMAAEIQKEWKVMLEQASEFDLDEIRKLYVKHSNVIGTTCVASANKQFMDTYPTFDVVIIDEVSKATPPELLLPMLKGKKIILVGDHHQLPPLVGDETFEETLAQVIKENPSFEQKRELEKLLEESLFERLYKNVPESNKKMLAIQYRMHENIMKTIAPFYENAQEQLQCGLENSDAVRDHLLTTPTFDQTNHLLWLDLPNTPNHYEERMKEGSSLFNASELAEIKRQLIEMNDATKQLVEQNEVESNFTKSVGVISFYAEQVKRINRLIEELDLRYLHIRTGSVDKFQGMEMDVIIVSMVRNHNGAQDIGFAKDYRRLNVALSRARELCILLGSTEMFTKVAKKKETREMYAHVLREVKNQQGYRLIGGAS